MNGHSNVLKRVFIAQTVLSSRKIKSFSELKCLILSKRFLGQPLADSIMNFDWSSLYNLSLLREISSVLSSRKIKSFSELKCLILSKRFLGQPLADSIMNFDWSSLYNLSLLREISSSLLHPLKKIPWSTTCLFNKEF